MFKLIAPEMPSGIMAEKFRQWHAAQALESIFLYGTFADPRFLQDALGLATRPTLEPASAPGFALRYSGDLPVLVPSAGEVVSGALYALNGGERACLVQLVHERYELQPIVLDGEHPGAVTLAWRLSTAHLSNSARHT